MKPWGQITILIIILSQCCLLYMGCKNKHSPKMNPEELESQYLEYLNSDNQPKREEGLRKLILLQNKGYGFKSQTKQKMLHLLEKEISNTNRSAYNIQSNKVDKETIELPKNSYIKILASTIATSNAEGSFPVLFELVTEGVDDISPALLATFDDSVLKFIIEKTQSETEKERKLSISILSLRLNPPTESDDFDVNLIKSISPSDKNVIKSILLDALKDQNYGIRFRALSGLAPLVEDPEVHDNILWVAKNDKEEFIRELAQKILNQN